MLAQRLAVHNGRSIQDATFELHDYTLLMGANNAGTEGDGERVATLLREAVPNAAVGACVGNGEVERVVSATRA